MYILRLLFFLVLGGLHNLVNVRVRSGPTYCPNRGRLFTILTLIDVQLKYLDVLFIVETLIELIFVIVAILRHLLYTLLPMTHRGQTGFT